MHRVRQRANRRESGGVLAAVTAGPLTPRARPPISLTSGCLIGVETNGVTGTHRVCQWRRPNARMLESRRGYTQADPPSLVRYHGETR